MKPSGSGLPVWLVLVPKLLSDCGEAAPSIESESPWPEPWRLSFAPLLPRPRARLVSEARSKSARRPFLASGVESKFSLISTDEGDWAIS